MPDHCRFQTSWKIKNFPFFGRMFYESSIYSLSFLFLLAYHFQTNVENDHCLMAFGDVYVPFPSNGFPWPAGTVLFPYFRISVWNKLWKLTTVNHIDHHIILCGQSYWPSHYSLWLGRILLLPQVLYLLRIRNHFYVIKNHRSPGSILFLLVEENLWHWTW